MRHNLLALASLLWSSSTSLVSALKLTHEELYMDGDISENVHVLDKDTFNDYFALH